MRTLGVDYGDARIGLAITDALGITAQGLETIHHNANDKIALKRIEEKEEDDQRKERKAIKAKSFKEIVELNNRKLRMKKMEE